MSVPASSSVGAVTSANCPEVDDPALLGAALAGDRVGGGQRAGHTELERIASISASVIPTELGEYGDHHPLVLAVGERRVHRVDRSRRVLQAEARLVEHEVVDVGGAGGTTHRAVGPVGVAEHGDGPAGAPGDGVDDGGDVLEVALDRVVGSVAAGAEAAAIHRVSGETVASTATNESNVV